MFTYLLSLILNCSALAENKACVLFSFFVQTNKALVVVNQATLGHSDSPSSHESDVTSIGLLANKTKL